VYEMTALDKLIRTLSRLPGVGNKSASRIAHFLLKGDQNFLDLLSDQVKTLKEKIRQCSVCGNYTETDPCIICINPNRDRSVICVVEQPEDITTLENTHEYNGLFHVLGGVISPLDGIGPEELALETLQKRVKKEPVKELILALNPTVQGDTTSLYISSLFSDTSLIITRLASGIPVGGDLGYADRLTLTRSLKGRIPIK